MAAVLAFAWVLINLLLLVVFRPGCYSFKLCRFGTRCGPEALSQLRKLKKAVVLSAGRVAKLEESSAPPAMGTISTEEQVTVQLPASDTPLLASPPRLSATGTPQSPQPLAETGRHAHEVWKRFDKIRLPKEKAQSTKRNFDAICQACGVTVIGKPQKMRKHLSGCQLANNGLHTEPLANTVRQLDLCTTKLTLLYQAILNLSQQILFTRRIMVVPVAWKVTLTLSNKVLALCHLVQSQQSIFPMLTMLLLKHHWHSSSGPLQHNQQAFPDRMQILL